EFEGLHLMSTYGAMLLGAGLLVALLVLLQSLWKGKRAPANPWGGATLEWHCTSPPPYYNFERAPAVGDPYDFDDLAWDDENERYVFVEPEREVVPQEKPDEAPAHARDDH
ncbi:MAG: cytochrome c oxidase subunit I, partial [Pirellulales bacterium]|nr:cytochrome c oxidase subunit I [Pirellulales bacterium]